MNLTNVRVKQVLSQQDLQLCLQIRHQVFVEEMKISKLKNYCKGGDRYDPHAIHFLMFVNGFPVGTSRLIPYDEELGLPIEKQWNIKSLCAGKTAEISQFCILKKYRSTETFAALANISLLYADIHRYDTFFVNANPGERFNALHLVKRSPFVRLLKYVGFDMFDIPKLYNKVGKMGVPLFMKLAYVNPRFKRSAQKYHYELIESPMEFNKAA